MKKDNAMTTEETTIQEEVQMMLDLLDSFTVLLEAETDALRSTQFEVVERLQDDKKSLAGMYKKQVTTLHDRGDEVATVDPSMKEKLIRARTQFTAVLQENLQALDAVRNSCQRLVNGIVRAARDAVVDQPNYSAAGRTGGAGAGPVSISVNTTL